jgi:lipopolysaccharide/colanic/teichoic acid biosynthesis glycosyltransferase
MVPATLSKPRSGIVFKATAPDLSADGAVDFATYTPPLLYSAAERLLALTLLLLTLPVLVVLIVKIRRESPGPALFVQDRIALGGKRPFRFVKLRSMYVDARTRFPELYDFSFTDTDRADIRLQLVNDPRVTPFGRFLRRSSLDELPNLWHVVKGDMRLVGPRPELFAMLPHYDAQTMRKFAVKPGVTGYAQVLGRGDLNFAETVELDLRYVKEASVSTDIRCLVQTFRAVVFQHGAH